MVNIDCDQKMRPRDRSQSHSPQRPRFSAVSMRPRTASLMASPSRARVDCQWNAKPRISTTKPVVADSVIDSADSERQIASLFSWTMTSCPGSDLTMRWVASAWLPPGSFTSTTSARWLAVSDCVTLSTSRMRCVSPSGTSIGTRARMLWSAPSTMTWRPDAMPQEGIRPGSNACSRSTAPGRSRRTLALRSRRSPSRSANADRSRFIAFCFCRLWSTTCTKAPKKMVMRKAMIRVGTARRSAGSAISSR